MTELFNPQNWIDMFHDENFWSTVTIITVVAVALLLVLFSDRLQQWNDQRRERAKWFHWNRG